jgi:urease accessory protein
MKTSNHISALLAGAVALLAEAAPASAHVGAGDAHGLLHGFSHPLGGIDHVLAMVAVGVLAASIGRRAVWMVPATFVAMMGVGGCLGWSQAAVPHVELGIALSLCVLGALIAFKAPLANTVAMAVCGLFAIFHGYAHGAEMPSDASGLSYAAGFSLATALLHVTGIVSVLALTRTLPRKTAGSIREISGAAIAVIGIGLLTGSI